MNTLTTVGITSVSLGAFLLGLIVAGWGFVALSRRTKW